MKVPGSILRPDHRKAISRYGIDRIMLNNTGIPNREITRLYQAFFVHTVGLYSFINEITDMCDHNKLQEMMGVNKSSLVTSMWRVFQVLLEYTHRSDYLLMITQVQKNHQEEIEKIKDQYEKAIDKLQESEEKLLNELKVVQIRADTLEKEKNVEQQARRRAEEELHNTAATHEEEVTLRIKFEEKLNNLHAINRNTESNYQSAKQRLEQILKTND